MNLCGLSNLVTTTKTSVSHSIELPLLAQKLNHFAIPSSVISLQIESHGKKIGWAIISCCMNEEFLMCVHACQV